MDQQERAPSGNEPPPLSGAPSRSFLRQTTRGDPSAVTGRYSQSLARADAAASASAEEDSDPTAAAAAAEEPLASNDGDDTTTSALDSSQGATHDQRIRTALGPRASRVRFRTSHRGFGWLPRTPLARTAPRAGTLRVEVARNDDLQVAQDDGLQKPLFAAI